MFSNASNASYGSINNVPDSKSDLHTKMQPLITAQGEVQLGVAPGMLSFKCTAAQQSFLQVDCTAASEKWHYRAANREDVSEGVVAPASKGNTSYMYLDWKDYGNYSRTKDHNLLGSFEQATRWEDTQRQANKTPIIYVHCKSGRGRSGEWAILYSAHKELQNLTVVGKLDQPTTEAGCLALAEYMFDQHGSSIKMARQVMDAANQSGPDSKRAHGIAMVREMLEHHWSPRQQQKLPGPMTTFGDYQSYRRHRNQAWDNTLNNRANPRTKQMLGFAACALPVTMLAAGAYTVGEYLLETTDVISNTTATARVLNSTSVEAPEAQTESMLLPAAAMIGVGLVAGATCITACGLAARKTRTKHFQQLNEKTARSLDKISTERSESWGPSTERVSTKKPKKIEKFVRQLAVDLIVYEREKASYSADRQDQQGTELRSRVNCMRLEEGDVEDQASDLRDLLANSDDFKPEFRAVIEEVNSQLRIATHSDDDRISAIEAEGKSLSCPVWCAKFCMAKAWGGDYSSVTPTQKEQVFARELVGLNPSNASLAKVTPSVSSLLGHYREAHPSQDPVSPVLEAGVDLSSDSPAQ